jgi:hypothetical protein
MGLAFSSMTNLVVEAVAPEQTGVATGMNANIRTIGGSVGSQVISAIIVASAPAGSSLPTDGGYTTGLVAMGAALLAAGLVAFAVPRARRPSRIVAPEEVSELELAADATVMAAAIDAGQTLARHR